MQADYETYEVGIIILLQFLKFLPSMYAELVFFYFGKNDLFHYFSH